MRAYAPILVAALLAGCEATVEVPQICITNRNIAVPGSPIGLQVSTPPFPVDVENEIPLLSTNASNTTLTIQSVSIIPSSGNPDLSGVTLAVLAVQPSSGSAVNVVSYQRTPTASPPPELVLTGGSVNITPYLVSGQANLTLSLSGRPPTTNWTTDVKTCLSGQSNVSP
ncbi:MAG TPA: hypothetical protein VMK12_30230 [Anaeromyxobacteraceae bacterium]|nr:hypothetical protein [Anaeromyxobacteraceae bacterium]